MGGVNKRKAPPSNGADGASFKKSKGGSAGKWTTPHQKTKMESLRAKGRLLEVGDVGFWASCQRGQEQRALGELMSICDEYGEKLYGIKPEEVGEDSDAEDADIEASIQKELDAMKPTGKSRHADSVFAPMRVGMDCLLFMKTKPPVEPTAFVRRIVEDAQSTSSHGQRKSRFLNRLTPITLMGKATGTGVEEVARTVLAEHFQLAGVDEQPLDEESDPGSTYAIRLTTRAHNSLKRDDVIKQIASLIGPRHKVNLTNPDKVIIVELFQTFCGMSVVEGDWDAMKRYNLNELYVAAIAQAREARAKADGHTGEKADEKPREKTEEKLGEQADEKDQ
ncbi:hypothetical protein JX265_008883 [Neoarthrinium moseri]|uniref:THUMP domain-containing protein n=1 Tax=Neoarthrinium moseri TaxID=1658444 RepID=A0A9P9WHP5_9PEZI|nr:hypothetical protein JX265_008883 [Neoarthrinium moseri]